MSEHEAFLREFHATHAGITARAMERGGSYDRFAGRAGTGRVLDLACGDGALLVRLPRTAVGLDLSMAELAAAHARLALPSDVTGETLAARFPELGLDGEAGLAIAAAWLAEGRLVCGRAQDLPFADESFDVVACHLAFMLFDDIERVVAEVRRVLVPGGRFIALLGGGPTANGNDAFHAFLKLLAPAQRRFGDPRASSEAGWRSLFAGWSEPVFERWELDLGGSFDEVWEFLGASYQLDGEAAAGIRDVLGRACADVERVPCSVVTFYAEVTR